MFIILDFLIKLVLYILKKLITLKEKCEWNLYYQFNAFNKNIQVDILEYSRYVQNVCEIAFCTRMQNY